jgi:hypothetical protein
MAVRAQELQILRPIIQPVAILVVDVEHDAAVEPLASD